MSNSNFYDQTEFEKALEEAKKQMSETNKMITLAS